jgi:hypothetical protein
MNEQYINGKETSLAYKRKTYTESDIPATQEQAQNTRWYATKILSADDNEM